MLTPFLSPGRAVTAPADRCAHRLHQALVVSTRQWLHHHCLPRCLSLWKGSTLVPCLTQPQLCPQPPAAPTEPTARQPARSSLGPGHAAESRWFGRARTSLAGCPFLGTSTGQMNSREAPSVFRLQLSLSISNTGRLIFITCCELSLFHHSH